MLPTLRSKAKSAAILAAVLIWAEAAPGGTVSGTILSNNDQPASGVLVILTDAGSGIPVTRDGVFGDLQKERASALTDSDGRFSIDVAAGVYNVVSQKWDWHVYPWKQGVPPIGKSDYYGPVVTAMGTAQNVAVPSAAAANVKLSPQGSATLIVEIDSSNDAGYVVVSKAPLGLDPVLGFAGWIGDFLAHAVAFNRTPKMMQVDFNDLPAGAAYVAIFGNDNLPGFGTTKVDLSEGTTTTVKMEWIGQWSNARKTPPPELLPLYEKFKANRWNLQQIPGLVDLSVELQRNPLKANKVLTVNEKLMLPDGTTATAAELYAVASYLQLNRTRN